jgi:Bacteriophage related domain of unknown function
MTMEADIYLALVNRLNAMTGGLPIVWPNTHYPEAGQQKADRYLVVSHAPNNPLRVHIDPRAPHLHRGMFGVSIMTKIDEGIVAASQIAGQIAEWFEGQILSSGDVTVQITTRPYPAVGYRDDDRWRTPVVIEFSTIKA